MKILVASLVDIGTKEHFGVRNKLIAQVKALQDVVGRVDFVYVSRESLYCNGRLVRRVPRGNKVQRVVRTLMGAWGDLSNFASHSYDLVYIRHTGANPSLLFFLRRYKTLRPCGKVVVEMPTYPYRLEYRSIRGRLQLVVDLICSRLLRRYVERVVTFYGRRLIYGIETIRLSNGIDLEKIPLKKTDFMRDGVLRLVCVANITDWHGIDRVIQGLRLNDDRRIGNKLRVELHVVGQGAAVDELAALASRLHLNDCIFFHGFRRGDELNEIFDKCDIGICSLGMHRKGLKRDDSLKTREYCARGIPFVLSAEDSDFPPWIPWAHHVPGDDSPIDVAGLFAHFSALFSEERSPDLKSTIRSYAECHLDWKSRMKKVTDQVCESFIPG